ncbi:M48 family metallopeptidase [Alloalcanivorax mobilis]|uniref:M48 family metallopeptidase n=1 Tax=Alloalcanivorax mobilis TaxID=2019569 RepID=UPI001E5D52B5|nr:SprT family zinc-dependent metalloprotease [Alloalcanivorax mobilis]
MAALDYELVRSRRRTLEVRVFADGRVQVRAPLRLARHRVEAFVDERRIWIHDQQRKAASRPRPRWRHGDPCRYLGETLLLNVDYGARVRVSSHQNELCVLVPEPDDEDQVCEAVHAWWRRLARQQFQNSIERQFFWFAERGHRLPVLRVKRMRTRWGSLSARGYINLNLALMAFAPDVIDYVVMHELCHLEFMHHGPQFHALMDRRMPDWRARKRRLEEPETGA